MACLKVSVTLMVAMLLIAAPVCAEDEYGDDYGGDYGEEGGGYGADPYGGGGYGDDYGMGGGMGGMGGMGGPPDASERIPGVLDLDKYTYHKVIDGSYPAMVLFYCEAAWTSPHACLSAWVSMIMHMHEYVCCKGSNTVRF